MPDPTTVDIIENQIQISKDIGEIKGMVSGINDTVSNLDKSINGNGTPGLKARTSTLERVVESHCAQQTKEIESISANIKALSAQMSTLSQSVEAHHKDPVAHKFTNQLNLRLVGIFVLSVAVIHSFIPPDFAPWEAIRKLLGF
jgi:hypothetical protein